MGGEGERWIEPYAQYFGGFIQGQGRIFELDLGVGRELLVPWSPVIREEESESVFGDGKNLNNGAEAGSRCRKKN